MADTDPPRFDNLLNFRDVGKNINEIYSSNILETGLVFRSAKLDNITLEDRNKIVNDLKIKTVVDLRSKTELINAARKHSDLVALAQSAALPVSTDAVAGPVKIPGLHYAEINLNGKGFERALIWKLKYTNLAKLVFLMAAGYRTEGISVLGKEIMLPRGLTGLGLDTLDHGGPEIKQVFNLLSEKTAYPVLIHCTQGKDRTGIVILLLLLLCDVKLTVISADYVQSESELEPEKEERMKEIRSIGLDESFAQCPPEFCQSTLDHLNATYGGINSYLERIGVDADQQEKIRHILLL